MSSSMMGKPTKYTLITNLQYVTVHDGGRHGVRTFTHALVLDEGPGLFGDEPRRVIQGYAMDPSLPTFDVFVSSLEYTQADAASRSVFIGGNGEPRPLSSGYILQFKDGPRLDLVVSMPEKPLDVVTIEGTYGDHSITTIWDKHFSRVFDYWSGPNAYMPAWGPVERVKEMRKKFRQMM